RFINAYKHGLNGAQAAWAVKKYHGHRVLPEDLLIRPQICPQSPLTQGKYTLSIYILSSSTVTSMMIITPNIVATPAN
ncbi:hypothetical protein BDR07DRAFT_1314853, partial [Suillus spraguei]